ncbi:Pyruvate dehydrogenase (acetyl-transferring) [Stanieria cyanosphaera PCC 7437]|uniref:Pyruvate dehydrogenase (Acetyl-transferring) n=1 Tax=Stanieria cyanosphaera (strain ATCC 29371 / PCC 7437) TaxID=111780 RepID=K9XN50_STAC7|nr:alpha-ketoacid dehydrogenase subunit alpha/beta [Stanieria cyanosphaera]AFZ34030.1 Pyruvate dehydrogenase (acetyl-transferring) [Stanieria cyanosphaera PCC 7437]
MESLLKEFTTSLVKQLTPEIKKRIIRKALLSRFLEEKLLELYSQGKLFGTVHTCIGQEFSGAVITEFLQPGDSIFSNHRCHGHFLSWTENVTGLIAEIMGKQAGVCSGRGGSQHLCQDGFFSNGIQGGIVPVATGLAFARKLDGKGKIATVFIGDGTLGEGVIYEAFNLAAKWELPLLVVLENNGYAQSTCQTETLAGDICDRAAAFGIGTAKGDTWNWEQLYAIADDLVNYVRDEGKPAFLQIDTFRLKAHSKGDDNRPRSVVEPYEQKDPLNLLLAESNPEIIALQQEIEQLIDKAVAEAEASPYPEVKLPTIQEQKIEWQEATVSKQRLVKAINQTFKDLMQEQPKMLFIGEDVKSPYGGAFKVAQELSDLFAERVFNTPISEAAIVGLSTGLAMEGYYPFVEIMFGDFTTLILDQILNHASKFRYMYDEKVTANAVIRTPMGGGRGYGPTHSQTLDRHFLGIPGLRVIAINNLLEPKPIYQTILETSLDTTLVIENKLLYSQYLRQELPEGFKRFVSNEPLPTVWLKPETVAVDVTLIGYGGMSETLVKVCDRLFEEHDLIAQIICPTQIYPFNIKPCLEIIAQSRILAIVEEGQGFAGFGAEIVAQLAEADASFLSKVTRIVPPATSIPASGSVEKDILPNVDKIIAAIVEM